MYSISLNEKITQKYKDYNKITKLFSWFFEHISYLSPTLFGSLNEKKEGADEEIRKWLHKLDAMNNEKKVSLSFVVICKNEERSIKECLNGIVSGLEEQDEVIVIDTGSVDETKMIITNNYKEVKLVETVWNDDFSEIRNKAITMVDKEWIFFIDADEVIDSQSIVNLRKILRMVEWYDFRDMVISPTIINSNGHIINCVKRIFQKKEDIRYFGLIHEEPRKSTTKTVSDLSNIAFDNVVLRHDGYRLDIVRSKNKVERNYNLLIKMIKIEPFNPRWKYFLCRDCKMLIGPENYENFLLESLEMCKEEYVFRRYKIEILTTLIKLYLEKNNESKFKRYMNELEAIAPELSNIVYLKALSKYKDYIIGICQLKNELILYRSTKKSIEYGGLHSKYYHIDLLIAQLLFAIGNYEDSFQIMGYLEKRGYGEYRQLFSELYDKISTYMEQ